MSENNSAVKATKTIHDMTTGSPAKLIVQFMINVPGKYFPAVL